MGLMLTGLTGCSSLAYRGLADGLASGGGVYASDDDIEFIGQASPFGLKTMETVLARLPEHRPLARTVASGYVQYAYVYLQLQADEIEDQDVAKAYELRARARHMYLRARDTGLRALDLPPATTLLSDGTPLTAVLSRAEKDDAGLLYYTALAWLAAISQGKDDAQLIAGLPQAEALLDRAYALDPDYEEGGLEGFLVGYDMGRPGAGPAAEQRAREHYARSIALSHGRRVAPFVTLAESVSIPTRNRQEFKSLLDQALAIDTDARPDWRLANLVMQRRARWLLGRVELYFPE